MLQLPLRPRSSLPGSGAKSALVGKPTPSLLRARPFGFDADSVKSRGNGGRHWIHHCVLIFSKQPTLRLKSHLFSCNEVKIASFEWLITNQLSSENVVRKWGSPNMRAVSRSSMPSTNSPRLYNVCSHQTMTSPRLFCANVNIESSSEKSRSLSANFCPVTPGTHSTSGVAGISCMYSGVNHTYYLMYKHRDQFGNMLRDMYTINCIYLRT